MPSFLSCSTTDPRLERRISGYVCSCRSLLKLASVYRRKHLPGCVRPARPARWCALACAHGDMLCELTRRRSQAPASRRALRSFSCPDLPIVAEMRCMYETRSLLSARAA